MVSLVIAAYTSVGFVAGVLSTVTAGLLEYMKKNNPKASAWSMSDVQKTHSSKGLDVAYNKSVIYHKITYYATTNYTNPTGTVTKFQVWTY